MKALSALLAAAVVFVTAGVLYCAHVGYLGLSLNRKIDPVSVVTLSFTVLIAIWLQYYFANRMSSRRVEKDLLIDDVRGVIAALRSCREVVEASSTIAKKGEGQRAVLLHFRRLSNTILNMETALGLSECKRLSSDVEPIWAEYLGYKAAATRAPFPSKRYSAADLSEQEQAFHRITKLLQKLVFDINKHD